MLQEKEPLLTMEQIRNTSVAIKCDWADMMDSDWFHEFCIKEDDDEVLNEFIFKNRKRLNN